MSFPCNTSKNKENICCKGCTYFTKIIGYVRSNEWLTYQDQSCDKGYIIGWNVKKEIEIKEGAE